MHLFAIFIEKPYNKSIHWICRFMCIPKFWSSSIRFSNQSKKTKRFNPKLFLAEPSEFLEKNHAEFFQDLKILFQSDENYREIPTTKPRDTFHLSSASLRPYFCDYSTFASPYLDKISLKSSFSQRLF